MQWHINRYDQLRSSTASRAGAVLSAGAILSAGNAVILSRVLTGFESTMRPWTLALISLATLMSTALVVISLFHASNVLVTRRPTRKLFDPKNELPFSAVFNGTDTVERFSTFGEFSAMLHTQHRTDVLAAAEVELWVGLRQHRRRYVELRRAVRDLRYAGLTFLLILCIVILANLWSVA
jgi:hypothetical protein